MNILITGSCGYLGSELCLTLIKRGHNVIGLDNLYYNQGASQINLLPFHLLDHTNSGNYMFVKEDCNDWDKIKKYVYNADILFPLHALVGEPICKKNTKLAKKTNLESIIKIVDNLGKDQRVIFPQTNSMYGTTNEICTEETEVNCLSLYSETKLQAGEYLLNNHKNSLVFRLATLFGMSPRLRLDLLVNDWIYKAYYNKEIEIYEPHFNRNYLSVSDAALAFIWAIENGGNGEIYNLGNDAENRTKMELAELINQQIPFKINIGDGKDPDKRNYRVSSNKLEKAGFKANTPIKFAIEQLKEYFKYLPEKKKIREKLLKYNRNY